MPIPVAAAIRFLVAGNVPGVSASMSVLAHYAKGKATRTLLSTLAPSMIRQGISANRALGLFRQAGIGLRRQDFLSLYRVGKSFVKTTDYLSKVGMGESLDMGQARTSPVAYPNRYTAKVQGDYYNKRTGEYTSRWVTMGINEGESKESIGERLWANITVWYPTGEPPEDIVIHAFDVVDLLESEGEDFDFFVPRGGLVS